MRTKDLGVRFKELGFYARFLLVLRTLNRLEIMNLPVERIATLADESVATFRGPNCKELKLLVQEIVQFLKVNTRLINLRPLRYCAIFVSHPASLPYVTRFHAKRVLKSRDALLTSCHRNEVKSAELTLDTSKMLQYLGGEPSGSFYQKHSVESRGNGAPIVHAATSGLIGIIQLLIWPIQLCLQTQRSPFFIIHQQPG
ncbi:hypothetical protein U1Q18_021801 [Sarracenia purpurea var. burkii]